MISNSIKEIVPFEIQSHCLESIGAQVIIDVDQ